MLHICLLKLEFNQSFQAVGILILRNPTWRGKVGVEWLQKKKKLVKMFRKTAHHGNGCGWFARCP